MSFRGYDSVGPVDRELRLACQARCGTRACSTCAAEIRRRESCRVEGGWRLFFTLTVPRERCSAADAWREVHGWIGTMTRELRRELERARDEQPRQSGGRHNRHVDQWLKANGSIHCAGKLEYAWVIEPHQDGYPHVHLVTNASWIQYEFLRDLWQKSTGSFASWVYGERVYSVNGTCRYLTKYISKATLTIEILAILFGRRLWASTIKRPEKPDPKWSREEKELSDKAECDAECGDDWKPDEGWKLESGKAGCYALWSRAMPERQPIIIAVEGYGDEVVKAEFSVKVRHEVMHSDELDRVYERILEESRKRGKSLV